MSYITPAGRRHLPVYKYKGEDRSLLYKYFGSPFAQYWVDNWTPRTTAPNTITLVGLLFQVLAYVVLASWSKNFEEPVPDAACYLAAACLFIYATLDNMDGKQARRVGASSPLGLLFDHGCDAINTGMVGSLVFGMVIGAGGATWRMYALWACVVSVFFVNTWEEFHLREFILQYINGPNEGLTMTATMMALTGCLGQGIWKKTIDADTTIAPVRWAATAFGPLITALKSMANETTDAAAPVTVLDVLVAFSFVFVGFTIVVHVVNVARHILHKDKGTPRDVVVALLRMAPLVLLQGVCGLWLHTPACHAAIKAHPHIFYLTTGALFAEMTSKLMVSHVADQPYRPNFIGLAVLAIAPLVVIGQEEKLFVVPPALELLTNTRAMLWGSFSLAVALLATFLYCSVVDIAGVLGISVFVLKRKEEEADEQKAKVKAA